MRVKDQANLTTIMAIVMLICFMMPWLKVGVIPALPLDGYQIPNAAEKAGILFSWETYKGGTNFKAYIAYILYLIPILSGLIIIQQIRDRSVTLLAIVCGLIPWLIASQIMIKHGMGAFDRYQAGLYFSILAGALMILDSTGMVKIPGLSSRR